jgi:hypothetical protein
MDMQILARQNLYASPTLRPLDRDGDFRRRQRAGEHRQADIVGRVDFDAGGHHRHPDDAVEAFVEGRAHDDVGVGVDLLADAAGGLVNLIKGEVRPPVIEISTPRAPRIETS